MGYRNYDLVARKDKSDTDDKNKENKLVRSVERGPFKPRI